MSLVSVIVPVYNAASFLDECLSSLVKQTHQELEILIVNDGSTDASPDICAKWAKQDSRVMVIDQPNQGRVIARQTGLEHAKGAFVAFVDADDWLDQEMVQVLSERMESNQLDFVEGGYRDVSETRSKEQGSILPPGLYDQEALSKLRSGAFLYDPRLCRGAFKRVIWTRLYRTEFIRSVHSKYLNPDIVYGEDLLISVACYMLAERIEILDKAYFYNHRSHDTQTMRTYSPKYIPSGAGIFRGVTCLSKETGRLDLLGQAALLFIDEYVRVGLLQDFKAHRDKGRKWLTRHIAEVLLSEDVQEACSILRKQLMESSVSLEGWPSKSQTFLNLVMKQKTLSVYLFCWLWYVTKGKSASSGYM